MSIEQPPADGKNPWVELRDTPDLQVCAMQEFLRVGPGKLLSNTCIVKGCSVILDDYGLPLNEATCFEQVPTIPYQQ